MNENIAKVNKFKFQVVPSSSKRDIYDEGGELEVQADDLNKRDESKKIKLSEEELQSDKVQKLVKQIGALAKERDDIKVDRDLVTEERDSLVRLKENAEAKYSQLSNKLREQLECPVCLEVPTSGPVHVCQNGHFVCSTCKQAKCPSCRIKMARGRSLLAVTVIENIEHRCKHDECEELLRVEDYNIHLETCVYNPTNRVILCPAPTELCGKEMELSKIVDHIESECQGSWNSKVQFRNINCVVENGVPWQLTGSTSRLASKGIALKFEDSFFYLNVAELTACTVLSIQHFGNRFECEKFVVDLSVSSKDDRDMIGSHVQKITCVPLPIEMDHVVKKTNGLMVGHQQMEKVAKRTKNGLLGVCVTVDIKKVQL